MRTAILLPALMLGAACATSNEARLPVCDGHSRRPANPHGSILTPSAPAPAPAPPTPVDVPAGGCA